MQFTPLENILISEDRQRREFDDDAMHDLVEAIHTRGLLHAIVVRQADDGQFILVAGERRLRAMRTLHDFAIPFTYDTRPVPLDCIPTVTLGELSELAALEAELSENIHRQDLTWQERTAAIAALHNLRTRQAATAGLAQTFTATATELIGRAAVGQPVTNVRESVLIAEHLSDPDVAKAGSQREAVKVIEKKAIIAENLQRAAEVGTVAPHSRHTLLQQDCIPALDECTANTFDCICTDPPYGIDAHQFGEQSDGHQYDDSPKAWIHLMQALAWRLYAVCKPEAHAYIFCDPLRFVPLRAFMQKAGWYAWRTPLVWSKLNGTLPRPEHGPRRTYETILYAIKGDKKTTGVYPDLITTSADHSTIHPAQKPVALYTELLKRSCRPGDIVCDPFAGSGTIYPAANRLALTAWGSELNPVFYAEALKRLEEQ